MTIGEAFTSVLSAAQADAGWAFERLYHDLAPAVHGYLRLQGAAEPEDLTSEVFLGAFTTIAGFRGGEEQFRSWLFTIAYRRLVDERRRASCRPAPGRGLTAPDERLGGDVEADALTILGSQRVRQLCQTLSPAQRDVLLLRLLGDLTLEQVATLLDKSVGAIKVLQCRGVATLRASLARRPELECVTI